MTTMASSGISLPGQPLGHGQQPWCQGGGADAGTYPPHHCPRARIEKAGRESGFGANGLPFASAPWPWNELPLEAESNSREFGLFFAWKFI